MSDFQTITCAVRKTKPINEKLKNVQAHPCVYPYVSRTIEQRGQGVCFRRVKCALYTLGRWYTFWRGSALAGDVKDRVTRITPTAVPGSNFINGSESTKPRESIETRRRRKDDRRIGGS